MATSVFFRIGIDAASIDSLFRKIRCLLPGVLRPELRVATVIPAAAGEGVVAALELARDLLVGGAAPRHQHHVESRQTEDRDGQQSHDSHYYHPVCCLVKVILEIKSFSLGSISNTNIKF